jgi:hypothetical protein
MMIRNPPTLPKTRTRARARMKRKMVMTNTTIKTKEAIKEKKKSVMASVENRQSSLSSVRRSHYRREHRPRPHLSERIQMNVLISSKYVHPQHAAVQQSLFRKALDPAEFLVSLL